MARILCAGIATIDQIYRLDAMPTRAEKYRARALHVTGGGTAANAAVAMARLGAQVGLFATLGDDGTGRDIVAGLEREGVDCSGVRRIAGRASPLSAILVDARGERMIVSYSDPDLPRDVGWLPTRLPAGVDAVLGDTRWQEGSAHLFRLAREAGVPAVLDGDRAPTIVPDLADLATHVAFSLQGLRDLTGEDDARRALEAYGRRAGGWVAVTNGREGAYFWRDGAIAHHPAHEVEVADTLGAGDAWHGALTVRLAEGADETEAVRFATAAAALKCARFGGRDGAPTRSEVEAFLAP